MFIARIGNFITRSVGSAGFCALLFALLPFLAWVALVIIALVTLRKSWQQGLMVVLWACLPNIAMVIAGWNEAIPQLIYFATSAITVWVMANLVWRTSWATMLQVMMGVGLIVVVVLHRWYPAMILQLQAYMSDAFSELNFSMPDQQQLISMWSQNAVRLMVASVTAFSCLWLVLGRWWQSALFAPGRLRQELHDIRMNKWVSLAVVVVIVSLAAVSKLWLVEVLPVIALPFGIVGLSLVHNFVAVKKLNALWLVGFYIILLFGFGIVIAILAAIAITNSWISVFNKRVK